MADKTWTTEVLTHSDMNTYAAHTGGAWNTYTPSLTQTGTVTNTVVRAGYHRTGRAIKASISLTVINGVAGNSQITVTTPVTAASSYSSQVDPVGSGAIYDSSANLYYPCVVVMYSTSGFSFLDATQATNVYLGVTGSAFNAALAVGDKVMFTATFEAASG